MTTTYTIDGVALNVADIGAGEPLLLVHGFPLNHTMWQAQWKALADTYRVIAPDLRGFGSSGVTAGTVTMDQFADDLARLLDALNVTEPVTFCGFSMGGYIAWSFVRNHGERLGRLVLCDTRAVADTPEAAAGRRDLARAVLETGAEPVKHAMLDRLFSSATIARRPELLALVERMIDGTPPAGIAAALNGMAQRMDATPLLAQITLPTLLLVGVDDKISTVDEMRQMAAAIPCAELVEISEAGHLAPMENPEAVNSALRRFLASAEG